MSDDDVAAVGTVLSLLLSIPAVFLGIRAARRKGISPHWMWLAVGGAPPAWITYAVIV